MTENYVEYWWRLRHKSWTFTLPPIGAWLWPSRLSGYKLTFGLWARLSKDAVMDGVVSKNSRSLAYQELEKGYIRVLALKPGEFSDPLRGKLIYHNLQNSDIEYEALSYAWGRRYPGCYIEVDCGILPIFGSLDDALRHLRKTTHIQYVWADSICINQENIKEKTSQVMLMKEVYQKARTVNIWLGMSSESSSVGMDILSFLASKADFHIDQPWTRYSSELCLTGLNDIIYRPYFQRIWVVQEIVVAKHLRMIVGKQSFEWSTDATAHFLARLKFAEISPGWEQAGLATADMTPLIEVVELSTIKMRGMQPRIGLLDVIHNMRHRKATDIRDMVFALIGLAEDEPCFKVDYSLRKEDLYQRLLKHVEKINIAHLVS